jgi:hypothetical protein
MRGTHRDGESYVLIALALSLCASVVLFVIFIAAPVAAEATRASLGDHGFGYDFHNAVPSIPDDRAKVPDSVPPPANNASDESCFMPPLTGIRSPSTRLGAGFPRQPHSI